MCIRDSNILSSRTMQIFFKDRSFKTENIVRNFYKMLFNRSSRRILKMLLIWRKSMMRLMASRIIPELRVKGGKRMTSKKNKKKKKEENNVCEPSKKQTWPGPGEQQVKVCPKCFSSCLNPCMLRCYFS